MTKPNIIMIGTGEYTTGYVHGSAAPSDKSAGVVGLTMFDLRRRGIVDQISMVGTNGTKFPGIRCHLETVIGDIYRDTSTDFTSYPADDIASDAAAFELALTAAKPGDVVTVFTPDDTHFSIGMRALERGCHVLIAKPMVKTLSDHRQLMKMADQHRRLLAMEVHKRWDPIYRDAKDRIRLLGDFSFFQSYMSQPKSQLQTFRAWAGRSSDISYYLNAHHIDFHVWSVSHFARPIRVYAAAASGYARSQNIPTEDSISLTVTWENSTGSRGTAIYTASWIAPKSDVHSQQRFHYVGQSGELHVDQAHRGYSVATDEGGYASANPLFMKYEPDSDGYFAGQNGYGYRSLEDFVTAATAINSGAATCHEYDGKLATAAGTLWTTAILEAGRKSLDLAGRVMAIEHLENGMVEIVES